jgi:hypothetical protein
VRVISLGLIGILFVVTTTAIGSADNNKIINQLSQTTEATTTTDISFGAKAFQFLTYCNNQFSQIPVSSMTTDTLVFCTMVYDWYLMGCNNTIIAPIIAAQCKDPVIMQQVNNYKIQIDIRIKQIIKIEVSPPPGKLRDLTISITIAKDPITRGNVQTITVTVSDSKSNEKIEGAKVNGKVQYVTGHIETFSCITDARGKCSHSWRISGNATPGTFHVLVEVSASGYKSASKTTSFQVVPKDNTTLPIVNDTIINETSRVMPNDTDTIGNETGFSDGENGGDTGNNNGDNATILPILPDPCLENPSLPECTSATLPKLLADPCLENPSLPECTQPTEPKSPHENPPPNVDGIGDRDDTGSGGDGADGGGSKVDNGISGDAGEAASSSTGDGGSGDTGSGGGGE